MNTNFAIIKLTKGLVCIVDAADSEELNKYTWQARLSYTRYYAQRKVTVNNREYWVKMHRQIMNTPDDMIVHHENRCTMDNRRANLVNMFQKAHQQLHTTSFPGRLKVQREKPLT